MKIKQLASAFVVGLLLFTSACVVAERPGHRRVETYYYYPDYEIYFYPRVGDYYWREREDWRHGPQPPPRFALRDRDRVRIDLDHEPHTDHDRIKKSYPPGRFDRDDRRDGRKDDRRG